MGIVIRQSIKSSVVSYVGVVLGAVNTIFLFPLYLTQREIGLINLLESIALILATFSALGVNQIADRYFPYFREISHKHRGYFTFLIGWNLVGFIVVGVIFGFFQGFWLSFYQKEIPEINQYFWIIIFFAGSIMASNLLESYSRIHLRIVVPNLLRQFGIRFVITLSIFMFAWHWIDFYGLVIWRIISYASMAFLLIFYLKNLRVLFLRVNADIIQSPFFKEMLVYGLFIVVGGAGSIIINRIDMLMIGATLSPKELGVYATVSFVGTVIEIPRQMFSQIITPIVSQAWADQDIHKLNTLYKKSSISQSVIGLLLFLGIWMCLDDLFALMPHGKDFEAGKYVVFYAGFTRVLNMVGGINYEILMQSRFYKFNLITVLMLAIFITLTNLIFIPWLGITGAAMATFISYFIYNTVKIIFLWNKFNLQPFSRKTLIILGIALFVYLIVSFLPQIPNIYFNIIFKSLVIFTIYVALVYLSKVSEEYNQIAELFLNKLWGKIQKIFRR